MQVSAGDPPPTLAGVLGLAKHRIALRHYGPTNTEPARYKQVTKGLLHSPWISRLKWDRKSLCRRNHKRKGRPIERPHTSKRWASFSGIAWTERKWRLQIRCRLGHVALEIVSTLGWTLSSFYYGFLMCIVSVKMHLLDCIVVSPVCFYILAITVIASQN